ncbi:hypothetical protein AXF42_Ash002525 [Apostasia shenzhenica]|uniref:Sugar-phosphatase n=1 Tax=Apostasia shenzhenica TaxID=1088818 RepID=A0A2I0ANS9_9ASPA|nr:hypothetical protein AXF42_Ash002525 [Apostasia shenzhenica]
MARAVARVLPMVSISSQLTPPPAISVAFGWRTVETQSTFSSRPSSLGRLQMFSSGTQRGCFSTASTYLRQPGPLGAFCAALRGFRKVRRSQAARKQAGKDKKLELRVKIAIEEGMPDDHEVMNIVEMLKLNAPMAMKTAFDVVKEFEFKTRDRSLDDISNFERIELSVLLCNDEFITKVNKDWQSIHFPPNVRFIAHDAQEIDKPILNFGDIVISAEAAARQAVEKDHTLLDEVRILVIRGLLHLMGFDHNRSAEAEAELENAEELVLRSLGWEGTKGTHDTAICRNLELATQDGKIFNVAKKAGSLRFYRPKFSYIFCDMDGTLLNSHSQITRTTAEALREALLRGVKVVIATGKTRPAVINTLKMVNLAGKNGIASELSPGIFLQGLLVYGRQGREIHRRSLDKNVCREALLYSQENEVPLIAFCRDRCLTLFDHPLVESLHTIYHEPKAEILPSVERLLAAADIQKLVFVDTAVGVSSVLRPHWTEATSGRASVVQAQADMLEIVPACTSKGDGVKLLLDHLGISAKEIMAIGDGENDIEMLQLASLGIALENGSEKAKAVADVIGAANDDDGVARAIYQYAF